VPTATSQEQKLQEKKSRTRPVAREEEPRRRRKRRRRQVCEGGAEKTAVLKERRPVPATAEAAGAGAGSAAGAPAALAGVLDEKSILCWPRALAAFTKLGGLPPRPVFGPRAGFAAGFEPEPGFIVAAGLSAASTSP